MTILKPASNVDFALEPFYLAPLPFPAPGPLPPLPWPFELVLLTRRRLT